MQTYELTYIISSQMTVEEAETVKKDFEAFLQGAGGVVLRSEKSTPQPLAYQIKKQSSGFFAVCEFQVEESKVTEIKASLEKNTKVLRYFLIVKKPIKIMKERRTRKPMLATEKPAFTEKSTTEKKKEEKLNPEALEKKLDEILSE